MIRHLFILGLVSLVTGSVNAAIIGTNVPSAPLTMERIKTLPEAQRPAWENYLQRSQKQMKADQDFFQAEMKASGVKAATNAPAGRNFSNISKEQSSAWYASNEAKHIANVIVSFQTPAGGWSKRLDLTSHERMPGEYFTSDNNSRFATNGDLDLPSDSHWSYVGTFDNDSTTTPLRFLAKVIAALPSDASVKYRTSFMSGLNYIFNAQYPNGGWPQVWPLQGGYHDAITYNDGAMIHILDFLDDVAGGTNEFGFVPPKWRENAKGMMQHGIHCVLMSQIRINGIRTVWCQQHDLMTLAPTSARNYEMPCATAAESAELMMFLMRIPKPDAEIVAAINAAGTWLKKTAIYGYTVKFSTFEGRQLVASPGSGPLWARYYELGTDKPIFGDRDKTIHDSMSEISAERRKGYSWYNDAPKVALQHYEKWKKDRGQAD